MWKDLPENEKEEYKRMILAFASLTELFSQKNEENDEIPAPIINSKYQETIFQKAFHASAEDIGNTSYDVAINGKNIGNRLKKYLIGIKTFGIGSGDQKVAQFKANLNEWSSIINQMQKNAKNEDGTLKKKSEIDLVNNDLYKELAVKISILRNERICSSRANLQGFKVKDEDEVESVYHVLMPSSKGQTPEIYVGETEYDLIDVANIEIIGCSSAKNPANFIFTDGKHEYKYTSADSQLYMKFNNKEIVLDTWDVKYAEDAYGLFSDIFINYDKQDDISDTTKYEDHFVAENRLIAISKSGRSMDSEDVQNFLNATERGIDVQLFVRKNKDDKISKEFYYLGRVIATGNAKQFVMPNTDKTAVEIEWELETPVREDIYQYIVNE